MRKRFASAAALAVCFAVLATAGCRSTESVVDDLPSASQVESTTSDQPTASAETEPIRALGWDYVVDVDRGLEVDGILILTEHADANKLQWKFLVDPAARYVYSARENSVIPGDELCLERIQQGDAQFERSVRAENVEFVAFEGPDQLAEPTSYPVLSTVSQWWELLNIDPPTPTSGERTAALNAAQIQLMLAALPNPIPDLARYQSGQLTTIESGTGELQSVLVRAEFLGSLEIVEGFTGASYQVADAEQLNARFDLLGSESIGPRLTATSSVEEGSCTPRSAWAIGEWQLFAVFPFDLEQSSRVIVGRDDRSVSLTIEADGSWTGTIGCTTFSGAADREFFRFADTSVVLDEDCSLTDYEQLVVAAFQEGELVADTAGQLIVLAEDPETGENVAGALFLPRNLLEIDFS